MPNPHAPRSRLESGPGLRLALAAGLAALGACTVAAPPAVERLAVTPSALVVDEVVVGRSARAVLQVRNAGEATVAVAVGPLAAPFAVLPARLVLAPGATQELTVTFAPTAAGPASAVLRVGKVEVSLSARGRAATCADTGCDDGNACTIDTCGADGACTHAERTCAPTACQLTSRCERLSGCVAEPITDGTPCGFDDCTTPQASVCQRGQCVTGPRADPAQCTNRWVPSALPLVEGVVASDLARHRLVRFANQETWEFDGAQWAQRVTPTAPPPRHGASMVYDAARARMVLFGGWTKPYASQSVRVDLLNDTWEWDGTRWEQRVTATAPTGRFDTAMAYDAARQKVVLFGGTGPQTLFSSTRYGDTWEYDGAQWTERSPEVGPSSRTAPNLAYDPIAQRVVLYGGYVTDGIVTDVVAWEWDGQAWTAAGYGPMLDQGGMAFDVARGRLVLWGRPVSSLSGGGSEQLTETWERSAGKWEQRDATLPPAQSSEANRLTAVVYDAARERVVLLRGRERLAWNGSAWVEQPVEPTDAAPTSIVDMPVVYDEAHKQLLALGAVDSDSSTWAWNGATWQQLVGLAPKRRFGASLTYDDARQRVVLFGGDEGWSSVPTVEHDDTWEWDGLHWERKLPLVKPSHRFSSALAYDAVRQKVVLFGGMSLAGTPLGDTWEWDGVTWSERSPAVSPSPRTLTAMAFDPRSGRVVLQGGCTVGIDAHAAAPPSGPASDTWEWDGTRWAEVPTLEGPGPRCGHAMAYDPSLAKVVLVGGADDGAVWSFDGAAWVARIPQTRAVYAPGGLAFDTARGRLTAFSQGTTWRYFP